MIPLPFPLGGSGGDYNSKKSRASVVNLIPEANKDGSFRRIISAEGLKAWTTAGNGPIRSNLWSNSGYAYFVSGDDLFRVDVAKNLTNLGSVFGSGRCLIRNLGQPSSNEIIVMNGTGDAYSYDASIAPPNDFKKIASNWLGAVYGDSLNERLFAA